MKLKLKYANKLKLKPIKADEVDIDKPYLAFQFGDEMRYFEVSEVISKEDLVSALRGHIQHKYPNTPSEEYFVGVDRKKWRELNLYED